MNEHKKLQEAREKWLEATREESHRNKLTLFQEACQLYIQASQEIDDVVGKKTMLYLAHNAFSEAARVKAILQAIELATKQPKEHKRRTSISLPQSQTLSHNVQEDSVSEHCRRVVMNAHLERLKGLQKVSQCWFLHPSHVMICILCTNRFQKKSSQLLKRSLKTSWS